MPGGELVARGQPYAHGSMSGRARHVEKHCTSGTLAAGPKEGWLVPTNMRDTADYPVSAC